MSQMIVRPPQFFINPFGELAEQYSVYVGKPFQDPEQPSSQLVVTDGKSGEILEQPIIITNGVARNAGGQQVLMAINTQNYSITYKSDNGVDVYKESDMFGDALESGGSSGGGGGIPEQTFNNRQQALAADLTGLNYIFIKGETAGWEGTEDGPTINSLYYYTGGTGEPSTGDSQEFYDAAGNEWGLAKSVAEQVNEAGIATNTQAIADNAADIAVNADDIADNAANISSNTSAIESNAAKTHRSQLFTSSGQFTKPSSVVQYKVTIIGGGGGGGGGGADTSNSSYVAMGGGQGGYGAVAVGYFTESAISIVIGGGGAGGSGNSGGADNGSNGSNGATSTAGSAALLSAPGGAFGLRGRPVDSNEVYSGGGAGNGGIATGSRLVNIEDRKGKSGSNGGFSTNTSTAGGNGAYAFGGGTRFENLGNAQASGFGEGGYGGFGRAFLTMGNGYRGGNGAAIVEWYE